MSKSKQSYTTPHKRKRIIPLSAPVRPPRLCEDDHRVKYPRKYS